MNDYYKFVPGPEVWPVSLYETVAKTAQEKDLIVEVGVGFGRSTCLMTELLALADSKAKLYAVDTFGLDSDVHDKQDTSLIIPWGESFESWASRVGGAWKVIDCFDFYMMQNPYNKYLSGRVQFPPITSTIEFLDNTVFFVMLNASLDPVLVKEQLEAWWPKIKIGGKLGIYNAGKYNSLIHEQVMNFSSDKVESEANTLILTK
jgi:hypothetical protein